MTLHIKTREAGGVSVLDLVGRLAFGAESRELARCLKNLATGGNARILLNLEELNYIDSCGVGELIAGFTTVKKSGGSLKLTGARDRVLQILQIVNLPKIIEVYRSEEEALESFA